MKETQTQTHKMNKFDYSINNLKILYEKIFNSIKDFPGGSDGKVSAYNVGDPGSIPESGRSPGEGNGNPLQYSCLDNSMDGQALWAPVHGVAKSRTQLSNFTF